MNWKKLSMAAALAMLGVAAGVEAAPLPVPAEPVVTAEKVRARRPKVYFTVFNNGYSGDPITQDEAQFDKLVKTIKEEGHFNAILCKWTEAREKTCEKYGVLMMVDLLADGHHLFRSNTWENAKALCEKLQGNKNILAYHLWSDRFGGQGEGRTRDIRNCQTWDPTHPTFIGTYQSGGIGALQESDFISYYDFSWKRGPDKNFPNLLAAWSTAKKYDCRVGRYVETDAGMAGKGNPVRMQYIQTTSIACGLRGTMFFIGSRIMDLGACQFNELGKDVAAVNAYLEPMREEIAKLGLPEIYSTPWTMDWNNRPVEGAKEKKMYPPGLDNHAFPADFWIQPAAGEFVMGVSKYDNGGKDVVFVANHNAYAEQEIALSVTKAGVTPKLFNRETKQYEPMKVDGGKVSFKLPAAGGAIILFE